MRRRRDGGGADATRWMRDDVDEANDASDARFGVVDGTYVGLARTHARARTRTGAGRRRTARWASTTRLERDDEDESERRERRRRRRGGGRGREGWR